MGREITAAAHFTDPRIAPILQAAFDAFSQYGYRRTSMEEIARRVEMSRPALYLRFPNKEAIFVALTEKFYAKAADDMAAALAAHPDPVAGLSAAFDQLLGEAMKLVLTSPHGAELMDQKHSIGAEAARAGEARLAAILAAWLVQGRDAGRMTFRDDPEELAGTILAALYGQKTPNEEFDAIQGAARRLAELFGRALTA